MRGLGIVTPVGGVALLLGWLCLLLAPLSETAASSGQ
jgi:uncharacterized membrane protein YgdD (TMEM256/DUF423 family)